MYSALVLCTEAKNVRVDKSHWRQSQPVTTAYAAVEVDGLLMCDLMVAFYGPPHGEGRGHSLTSI